jgi:alkanesulfonate monooxygenase SsuD/methylene tetrahydromethanopterin reductase-like flavin-dependent oxidoreductase (luciferase family)
MKLLYYTPISWPYLQTRCQTFPHSNELFDADRGVEMYKESLDLFRTAEDVGFDWLGVGEEHMNAYGVVPNPCLLAAALAPVTARAKLCIMGNPLPLLNPLRVAEEYAMVDILSGGRLVAGFPRGVPQNYEAYGVDLANSKERLAEAIEFVIAAWSRRGPFDWRGTHFQFNNVTIWPQPTRVPDIVLSAKSPESVSLAVKHKAVMGEVYVKSNEVLKHFIANIQKYRRDAAHCGWEPRSDRFLLSVPCVIASTTDRAFERALAAAAYAGEYISGSFDSRKSELRDSYYQDVQHLLVPQRETMEDRIRYGGVICGDPAAVVDQIHALKEATGVGVLGLQMQWGNLLPVHVRESLELFGTRVRAHIA